MTTRIVAGVDDTVGSDLAIEWAAQRARLVHLPLTLLHALPEGVSEEAGRRVLASAETLVRRLAPQVRVARELVVGDPVDVLVDRSEAELLVLGSRGRGPVRSTLLGSVGAAVVRRTSVPVVVARPHRRGLVRRGVLVGADASAGSLPVLELAYLEASLLGLPLTVLHVPALDESYDDARLALAESVSGLAERFPDVHTTYDVSAGSPSDRLLSVAALMHLVVVGRRHHTALSVLEHAHTVVAVVPETSG